MKKTIFWLIASMLAFSCAGGNSVEFVMESSFVHPLWRGERQGVVVDVISGCDLKGATLKVLNAPAKPDFLFDVIGDVLGEGENHCGCRPAGQFDSIVVADRIGPETGIDIQAGDTVKVWLQLDVPADCRAGQHKGILVLKAEGGKRARLPFTFEVSDNVLPDPAEWTYHLDLWQNPYSVARYFGVELWSEEHFAKMRPIMELLASAGQKVVTATILNRPWNGQTEDPFGSMVVKKKSSDGSWTYDYSVFDRWVEFMFSLGIDSQVNCYSMIPWSQRFDYVDAESGERQSLIASPGSPEYADYWTSFLRDFSGHLKEKGWFEKTTIAMDERAEADMAAALKVIRTADPDFKIALTGDYHKSVEPEIYDMCFSLTQPFMGEVLERRNEQGLVTTWYVSCASSMPNIFMASDPMEAVWMGWYTAAKNYSGMLRWAYNSWTAFPTRDARFRTWPAGDCYFIYPESSSVRMQRLIEGIQDFEKVNILRSEWEKEGCTDKLEALDAALKVFEVDTLRIHGAADAVNSARRIIGELQK